MTSLPRRPGNHFPGSALSSGSPDCGGGRRAWRSSSIHPKGYQGGAAARDSRSAIFTEPRGRWGTPGCGRKALLRCPPLHASSPPSETSTPRGGGCTPGYGACGFRHRPAPITNA
ncbi:hypothetical protein NN561_001609 [Cricetulus griseus]